MDSIKIFAISISNYVIGLTEIHEVLQIAVASLSIILLLMNIKEKK